MQPLEKLRGVRKNDWIALGATLLLHGGLLGAFLLVNISADAPPAQGFVEVELGALAEGRPVQKAPRKQAPPAPTVEPTEKPKEKLETEEITTKPVDLPDAEAPEPETVQKQQEPEEPTPDEESGEETIPPSSGGGAETGSSGEQSGDEGEGADEKKSAPFQIEGLDRVTLTAPTPPRSVVKENAIIRVRITVGPDGRVVRRIPLIKGNPRLEQAVMDVLERWRFNALPDNAPQKNQTGTITFRFRLN